MVISLGLNSVSDVVGKRMSTCKLVTHIITLSINICGFYQVSSSMLKVSSQLFANSKYYFKKKYANVVAPQIILLFYSSIRCFNLFLCYIIKLLGSKLIKV